MIFTSTVEKPSWRCAWTLPSRKRSNSVRSPLGEAACAAASPARWPPRRRRSAGARPARRRIRAPPTQSPSSSSSTCSRKASMPILSTRTLIRARARLTRSQSWRSKIRKHGLGDLHVVAVVGLDELVERRRDAGHDRGAAADPDLEALDPVPFAGEEGDVVDAADRPVLVGAGEGGLDLARHQLRRRVADEVADVGAGVGRRVEDLVGGDAGPGVAGDVAHRVAAALAGGEAGRRRSRGSATPCRAAARGGSGCSGGW